MALKPTPAASDRRSMPTIELPCPICCADIPLSGDEVKGEEVYCTYCGSPCRLTGKPGDEDCSAEEEI
jgi:hypothetical protein